MTAHVRIMSPDWPRMMQRRTAALYCDMTEREFELEVSAGVFPLPVEVGGAPRWSRVQLDAALDRLTGDRVPDWRKQAKFYAKKA